MKDKRKDLTPNLFNKLTHLQTNMLCFFSDKKKYSARIKWWTQSTTVGLLCAESDENQLGSRGWLLKETSSDNRSMSHSTKAGKLNLGFEKISTLTSNFTSVRLTLQIAIHLNIMCGAHLGERPTKLHATPKMNEYNRYTYHFKLGNHR